MSSSWQPRARARVTREDGEHCVTPVRAAEKETSCYGDFVNLQMEHDLLNFSNESRGIFS